MTADTRFKQTKHLVEATSYEKLSLWQEWHKEVTWDQDPMGTSAIIGTFGGMPLNVSLFWSTIGGKLICFFENISMVSHSDMTRAWLNKNFPEVPITNAMNFHNAVRP